MPPSCALLGRFAIGARVALLWQHNANRSYKPASTPRYDDIVRTLGWAASARAAGWWLAGDGDVLNITAAAWTAGFCWWRSDNITWMQNVSEYMLVLALCLVTFANDCVAEGKVCLVCTVYETCANAVLLQQHITSSDMCLNNQIS